MVGAVPALGSLGIFGIFSIPNLSRIPWAESDGILGINSGAWPRMFHGFPTPGIAQFQLGQLLQPPGTDGVVRGGGAR